MMAQMVKNLPAMQEPGFNPWVGKIPWRRAWKSTLVWIIPMDRGTCQATAHGVKKSQT